MDDYTIQHLARWLIANVPEPQIAETGEAMLSLVEREPGLLNEPWSRVRDMVERNRAEGLQVRHSGLGEAYRNPFGRSISGR